jgi:chromosome partitioning protein
MELQYYGKFTCNFFQKVLAKNTRVRRQINPMLTIDGVLLTMVDNRTNFAKDISFVLRRDYGDKLLIFKTEIPLSIRAAETSAQGKSIYAFDPHGIAAKAYQAFTKEVQDIGEKQRKRQHQADISR